jgi:hypothetical protein
MDGFSRFKADENWNIKEINYGYETMVPQTVLALRGPGGEK